tara:strand:- start:924 stop:1268 length:345 start_codon:yes stop_codon:yes gene_type:complete
MDKIQEEERKRKADRLNEELKRRVGALYASRTLLKKACDTVSELAACPQPASELIREIDNLKELCNDWKYNFGMIQSHLKSIQENRLTNEVSYQEMVTELQVVLDNSFSLSDVQ